MVVVLSVFAFLGECRQSAAHTLDTYLLTRPWVVNSPATLVIAPASLSKRKLVIGSLHMRLPAGWRVLSGQAKVHSQAVVGSWTFGIFHPHTGRKGPITKLWHVRVTADVANHPAGIADYGHLFAGVYLRKEYRGFGGAPVFFAKYRSPWALYRAVYGTDPRFLGCARGRFARRLRCLLWLRVFVFSGVRFFWQGARMRASFKVRFPDKWDPGHPFFDVEIFNRAGDDHGFLAVRSPDLPERQAVFAVAELLSTARFARGASPTSRTETSHGCGIQRKKGRKGHQG